MTDNSLLPFTNASLKQVQESLGLGRFPDATSWNLSFSGFIFQGGLVSSASANSETVISFSFPYNKQTLTVLLTPVGSGVSGSLLSTPNLNSFTLKCGGTAGSFYWLAIGV